MELAMKPKGIPSFASSGRAMERNSAAPSLRARALRWPSPCPPRSGGISQGIAKGQGGELACSL